MGGVSVGLPGGGAFASSFPVFHVAGGPSAHGCDDGCGSGLLSIYVRKRLCVKPSERRLRLDGGGRFFKNARWLRPQAHKVQISIPGRKKEAAKKQVKKSGAAPVQAKNRDNPKKSACPPAAPVCSFAARPESTAPRSRGKSASATSDVPGAEREKAEGKEESGAPAPSDQPAASTPPAPREVPPHLRKPDVRDPGMRSDGENSRPLFLNASPRRSRRSSTSTPRTPTTATCAPSTPRRSLTT